MSDLVGNPEDRFSHNETHIETRGMILRKQWPDWSNGADPTAQMCRLICIFILRFSHIKAGKFKVLGILMIS